MTIRIALFDRNDYDDVTAYGRFGKLSLHTRYNGANAADADIILTTFTRPPDIDGVIVNMASSDQRHLSHIKRARVIQAGSWNKHDVARWVLDRIPPTVPRRDDVPPRVAVIGRGTIGKLVHRYLTYRGCHSTMYPHNVLELPPVDVITIHTLLEKPSMGDIYGERYFRNQNDAIFINSARRGIVSDHALKIAFQRGQLLAAHLDGGGDFSDRRVTVTSHVAWRGERSRRLRRWRVITLLERLTNATTL